MKLEYHILDVFTDRPLAGNQLAVVRGADTLSKTTMQAIAREFNLSETVFIHQPRIERHTAKLRIFTVERELPFAGHPTVGAAVLLGLQQRASAVRLEEEIGLITCIMERKNKTTASAHFKIPKLPEISRPAPPLEEIALTLGISVEEIGCGPFTAPAVYNGGVEFFIVPVRDADVLKKLKLERRGWEDVYGSETASVYVFTQTREEQGNDLAARMFSPDIPRGEDAATGSAAAALIGMLATDPEHTEGQRRYRLRQGYEMSRPSLIDVQVGVEDNVLIHGGIGGSAIVLATGELDLHDLR